jgi:DegV family protein with EDD domain
MAVKIITDTLSDITGDLIEETGVDVVPLYVRFGERIYRDRIDITSEEFYRRLVTESTLPSTTQPTPNDFYQVYEKLAEETDEILVITVSSKLSGTFQSATQAISMMEGRKAKIEVVDSGCVAMTLGLPVIATAAKAKSGLGLADLVEYARAACQRSHLVAYFDTLKYLAKGGRIGKAQGLLGSMLSVKPILTMKEGEMAPLTRVRSKSAGMDYLFNAVSKRPELLAVEHCTTEEDADGLAARLNKAYPDVPIYRSVISPVIGTYSGPGAVAVSVLEAE